MDEHFSDEILRAYDSCTLCPRNCKANRASGERGVCRETSQVRVARASLHLWEEPCISGAGGSGTVFFSGCSLHCVYCQNHRISDGSTGTPVSVSDLADIFLKLRDMGADNINLVTPTHFVPSVASALRNAKRRGMHLPIVYNTSAFERVSSLKYLDGLVDIYLPDFKYFSPNISQKYSEAPCYTTVARDALSEMYRQVGVPRFEENAHHPVPLMKRGMLVRHLVLPGCTEDSKAVLRYLYETFGDDIYISIMNQYTPSGSVAGFPEINRRVLDSEYDEVVDFAVELGISNAFIQEGEAASESFIPDFTSFDLREFLDGKNTD